MNEWMSPEVKSSHFSSTIVSQTGISSSTWTIYTITVQCTVISKICKYLFAALCKTFVLCKNKSCRNI